MIDILDMCYAVIIVLLMLLVIFLMIYVPSLIISNRKLKRKVMEEGLSVTTPIGEPKDLVTLKSIVETPMEMKTDVDINNPHSVAKLFSHTKALCIKWRLICIPGCVLTLVLAYKIFGSDFEELYTFIIIAWFVLYCFKTADHTSDSTAIFQNMILFPIFAEQFPDAKFSRYAANCNDSWFISRGLSVVPYKASARSYLTLGTVGDSDWFELFNLDIYKGLGIFNKKSFKGFMLHSKLTRSINGTVRIFTTHARFGFEDIGSWCSILENESRVETESVNFNKCFEVYAANEVEGYLIVSPYVIECLNKLRTKVEDFCIFIENDNVYLMARRNTPLFHEPAFCDPEKYLAGEYTTGFVSEVKLILDVVNSISVYISGHVV